MLCKSSLDLHKSVAAPFVGESPPHLPNDHPSLGFCTVVAPFGKTESAKKSSFGGKPLSGSFHQQCRPLNASNKMAPDLHFVIRKKLEEQQISSEGIQAYLNQLPSLTRYQSAFEVFWRQCVGQNLDLSTASLWEIASQLLKLNVFQTHQARNAYSALLLIPGLDQLRFSPLLKQIKKGWNQSVPKYATFWSGSNFLKKLATQALDWTSPSQIRDRLILSWRLVQLCRSIDLARLFRKVTMVDGRPFVWIQRKGWTQPRWEEVLCPPPFSHLCPWTLQQAYVDLTRALPGVSPGSLVLKALQCPFAPLTANAIGALTGKLLEKHGIPKNQWDPTPLGGRGVPCTRNWA